MKKSVQRFCLLLSAAVLLSICSSCTPRTPDKVKAEAAGGKVSLDDKTETGQESGGNLPDDEMIISVIGEPEGRDFLLFRETAVETVYPEDFAIGPLQPVTGMDENESLIYELAAGFAASIIGNEPDAGLVYSGRREFVMRNLGDMFSGLDLSGYRLGIVDAYSQPAAADLRFFGKDGFIDGTIYFIRESRWLIYDLQLDASETDGKEKMTNEKWFPIYNKVM